MGCSNDDIVLVDGQQQRIGRLARRGDENARAGKGGAEIVLLDLPCRLGDLRGYEARNALGLVGPTGRDIECTDQLAVGAIDRRVHATHRGVAGEEMLGAVDRHLSAFGKAGTNAVGAFGRLTPYRAGAKAPALENVGISGAGALIEDDTVGIRQEYAAAGIADQAEKLVEPRRSDRHQPVECRAAHPQAARIDPVGRALVGRIEPVLDERAPPGRCQPRHSRGGRRQHGLDDHVGMIWLCHWDLLPTQQVSESITGFQHIKRSLWSETDS